jgi:hypothetical protein
MSTTPVYPAMRVSELPALSSAPPDSIFTVAVVDPGSPTGFTSYQMTSSDFTLMITGDSLAGTFINADLVGGILTIPHTFGIWFPATFALYDNNDVLIANYDSLTISSNTLTLDLTSFGTLTDTWRYTAGSALSSGSATIVPPGANGNLLFNDVGVLGATGGLTYDDGTDILNLLNAPTIGGAAFIDSLIDGVTNAIITLTQETNFETAFTHAGMVVGNPHVVTAGDIGAVDIVAVINAGAATIDWDNIDKTGSSLADLATRSADNLDTGNLAFAQLPNIAGTWAVGAALTITTTALTILGAATPLVSITPGTGSDNDKLVTQGYVDEAGSTSYWQKPATVLLPTTAGVSVHVGNLASADAATFAIGGVPTAAALHIYTAGAGFRVSDPTNTAYAEFGFSGAAVNMNLASGPTSYGIQFAGADSYRATATAFTLGTLTDFDMLNVTNFKLFGETITDIATGTLNNDLLATQGYVDDSSGGGSSIEIISTAITTDLTVGGPYARDLLVFVANTTNVIISPPAVADFDRLVIMKTTSNVNTITAIGTINGQVDPSWDVDFGGMTILSDGTNLHSPISITP